MVIVASLRSPLLLAFRISLSRVFEICILDLHIDIMSARLLIDRAFGPTLNRTTCRRAGSSIASSQRQGNGASQKRKLATAAPPVTQDSTSSKGPTAMVFMNMGGPSTTDEVGTFLSRLFVSLSAPWPYIHD
jgi:hypothetical protein